MTQVVYLSGDAKKEIFKCCSCAFGVFDGVHKGHRSLIEHAKRTASETSGKSVVLTFSIDPDELFAPDRLVKLMSNDERIKTLARTGVDAVAVLPFSFEFAALSPGAFLEWAFADNAPAHMHVGEGFRFGCRNSGTPADMASWRNGCMQVHEHELVSIAGAPVSATRVRGLLGKNNRDDVKNLLGLESFALVLPLLEPHATL